jgi:P-type conjugative transfer protein TrbG
MIRTAAILLAFQAVAGAPSSQQNMTLQQKQALSQYNFKGARAALNAQTAQPSPATPALVRIPPLQVPPTETRIVRPSGVGKVGQAGAEVPAGWQPPHSELGSTGLSAVAVARDSDSRIATPTPGNDGRVLYIFGQGTPVMVCAPLRVCAVELQAGEHLESQPQIGDSSRWEVTPVISGTGLNEAPILIVKPIEAGLETDLIVPTDRRTYVVKLISDQTRFISRLAFQYPADEQAKWATFQAREDAAKRDAEMLAEQQRTKDKQAGVLPMADGALDNLYFDYKLEGDPAYRPERVLDDGVHTYLIYPDDGRFREMPTLLIVVNGETELVNFRVDGSRYIVDRLFDKAILVVGTGKKQTRVTITRAKPYASSTGKRS